MPRQSAIWTTLKKSGHLRHNLTLLQRRSLVMFLTSDVLQLDSKLEGGIRLALSQ